MRKASNCTNVRCNRINKVEIIQVESAKYSQISFEQTVHWFHERRVEN